MNKLSCHARESTSEMSRKSFTCATLSEKRGRPNIHQELVNLSSQVQMMSDSRTASQIFSKHPSSCKEGRKWRKSTSAKMFAEDGESKPEFFLNYVINENKNLLYLRKSRTFTSQEEILTKRYSDESVCSDERFCKGFESFGSCSNVSREFPIKRSKVRMFDSGEVNVRKMFGVIERELNHLAEVEPSVILIVSTLTDTLSHCQECRRCHEKISPSLPWILSRVQKLINYVTSRKKESYISPDDLSCLRLNVTESSLGRTASSNVTLVPVTPPRLVGKLEKVDPVAVSEDDPGVQLLLEVKPEVEKKKVFLSHRTEEFKWVYQATFPVVLPKESRSAAVVQILKPTPRPTIVWEEKRELTPLRELGISFREVNLRTPRVSASVTVAVPQTRLVLFEKIELAKFVTDYVRLPNEDLLAILIEQREWNVNRLLHGISRHRANDKEIFLENFRAKSSESFIEAVEEEMQAQRVNELEEEVKELKDLMLEVHKNQTELGKLLLEKKVFSQLMVKFTDPKILDEESDTVKRASKMMAPSTSSSMVDLQMKVDSLKRKCGLKNRLIMTLLRGLQSNVPKEVWEEVIAYAFGDSESVDEIDSERINEFIRQTSLFLTNEEKEQKLAPLPSRTERQSAEEEPKVKGIVGAEVEDSLKNLSCYVSQESAESKGVSSRTAGPQSRIQTFPVLYVPDYAETAVRKLENQISALNMENEKLWHQVNELRELLNNSVKEVNLFESDRKMSMTKSSAKTVNLVIQIAEKEGRRSFQGRFLSLSPVEITDEGSKTSLTVTIAQDESVTAVHEAERENASAEPDVKFAVLTSGQNYEARPKSDRRRSENDLNYLDDVKPDIREHRRENEKLRALLRERKHPKERSVKGPTMVRTPQPSAHEMFQGFKPVTCVPSKYVIPEACNTYGPGPSPIRGEMTNLFQKPSLMELAEIHCAGMYATTSNERELQTIPENDPDSSSSTSRGVSQAIQRLRTRVRCLHKDMIVLRSKNDRIDKLLDKLMDDVVENNENYEDLQGSLSSLKSRLG